MVVVEEEEEEGEEEEEENTAHSAAHDGNRIEVVAVVQNGGNMIGHFEPVGKGKCPVRCLFCSRNCTGPRTHPTSR